MTNIKVTVNVSNTLGVKLKGSNSIKVNLLGGGITVPASFIDLIDFDPKGNNDKYVLMYNSVTEKYEMVNPDEVLNAAASEPIQPGLVGYAQTFLNTLDRDLDNMIDVDAGGFIDAGGF
jgi:hypothetical protein